MKIKSTVQVNKRFDHVTREYSDAIERALVEAGAVGAEVASSHAAQRSRSGAMANVRHTPALPLRGARHGADVVIYSSPYYATYQNWGTLSSRTRKLKQPGRRKREGVGVRPLYFMEKGRSAGRKVLLARLANHIRKVR